MEKKNNKNHQSDMLEEYDFSSGVRGKYAKRCREGIQMSSHRHGGLEMVDRDKLRVELDFLGVSYVSETLEVSISSSQQVKISLGEHQVRNAWDGVVLRRIFYPEEIPIVKAWLAEQKLKEKTLSRDNELAMTKEANDIAKNANRISWLAVALSAISLIASTFAIFR